MIDQPALGRLALDAAVEGCSGVLVRTISTRGFGARAPLEAVLLLDDGRRAGSILGGRLDPSIVDAAGDVDRFGGALRIGVSDAQRADGCGGVAELLVQRLASLPHRYWAPAARPDVAVTMLGADLGRTAIVAADGALLGSLGDPHLDESATAASGLLRKASRALDQVLDLDTGHRVLLEVRRRAAHLVIAGGGELADATASLVQTFGWTAQTSTDPTEIVAFLDACGSDDALVVMTHDPALDEPVIVRAATLDLGYVGVLGSREVHRARHARLRRCGVEEAFIDRLRGPAGLDIGAWTPAETAVSLVAEILAVRGGRTGRPFTELDTPIHP